MDSFSSGKTKTSNDPPDGHLSDPTDGLLSSLSALSINQRSTATAKNHPPTSGSKILGLSDFPESYKTADLASLFKDFKFPQEFSIKWLTDTSALAIFKTPELAKSAYLKTISNPSCNISVHNNHDTHPSRPFYNASQSMLSSVEASPSSRPVTTDVVARRLVAGALGLKLESRKDGRDLKESQKIKVVREQREKERQRLEQREKDLNAAWDE